MLDLSQEYRKCKCSNYADNEEKFNPDQVQRFRRICCKCGLKTKWYKNPRIVNMNWQRLIKL